MCRLYGFRANAATKVECSLVHAQNALMLQSRGDRTGRAHPDGWGIAYYRDGQPHLERRAAAAYADLHFSSTAERVFANTVVAHVRQATVGSHAIRNCHPFQVGRWTFAHNGTVTAFTKLQDTLLAELDDPLREFRVGDTDSELVFLWLLRRLISAEAVTLDRCRDLSRMRDAMADSLLELNERNRAGADEPARLNMVLTDGLVMVATRIRNSLTWVERVGIHDCEICGIPHLEGDEADGYRAVVLASEPLSSEAWREIPDGSIVTVDEALQVDVRPLRASGPVP